MATPKPSGTNYPKDFFLRNFLEYNFLMGEWKGNRDSPKRIPKAKYISEANRNQRSFIENGLSACLFSKTVKDIKAVIAIGSHLFPFRTESLNLSSPMVLHHNVGE